MPTNNADKHLLMRLFHKPGDEKRMVVILPEDSYGAWLQASADHSREFMRLFPADQLASSGPESRSAQP